MILSEHCLTCLVKCSAYHLEAFSLLPWMDTYFPSRISPYTPIIFRFLNFPPSIYLFLFQGSFKGPSVSILLLSHLYTLAFLVGPPCYLYVTYLKLVLYIQFWVGSFYPTQCHLIFYHFQKKTFYSMSLPGATVTLFVVWTSDPLPICL